MLIKYL